MVFALLFFSVSVCVTNIGVFFSFSCCNLCDCYFSVHSRSNCSAALALVSVTRARTRGCVCVFVFCHLVILKVYVIASTNRKNN